MPLAQLSVLKYQLKPQIGLNATKKAVRGRPRCRSSTRADASELRARRNRVAKPKRLASHLAISEAAIGFIRAAADFVPKWSDHARRSTGLVKRRHRRRKGRMIVVANASVMRTSPAVAMKGETIPSTESEVGMRPTWIAKNTPTRVKIHKRSVAITDDTAPSVSACSCAKTGFGARPSPESGWTFGWLSAARTVVSTGASSNRQPAARMKMPMIMPTAVSAPTNRIKYQKSAAHPKSMRTFMNVGNRPDDDLWLAATILLTPANRRIANSRITSPSRTSLELRSNKFPASMANTLGTYALISARRVDLKAA